MPECTRDLFLVNGELKHVSGFDRFFSPGKNYIYEVFRVIDGVPLFIHDHLERFFQTTFLSGVDAGRSESLLLSDIIKLIKSNGPDDGNIKISIAPGTDGISNLLIYYTPHVYPSKKQFEDGIAVKMLEAERHNPNAKVMDISLRAETDKIKNLDEVYEVLLVDRYGCITEGSRSNVFFISGDEVITPPLEAVLPGVTRKQIIGLCQRNGIKLSESRVHQDSIGGFSAAFISGTSRKVLPVNRIDQLEFAVTDSLLRRIESLFNHHVAAYLSEHKIL